MNKLCIVGRNFETYFCQRLIEEVGIEGITYYNPWTEDAIPSAGLFIMRCTGVYGDDQDLLKLSLLPQHVSLVNPLSAMRLFREKPAQFLFWQDNGVSVLPWKGLRHSSLKQALSFYQQYQLEFGIVKPVRGQQGWGVRKLNEAQMVNWWAEQESKSDFDYLLQPYLKACEFRVFYIGERWWVLERVIGEGGTANFAIGGQALISELPAGTEHQVRKMIELSGTHYGALDFLYANGKLNLLELNVSPGIEQLEQVTGENIMKQLLNSLKIKS